MARMLETDVNMAEIVADIDVIESKFDVFENTLRQEIDEAVESVANKFHTELIENIKRSGIDEETGEFLDSWEVDQRGTAHYRVQSDARTRDGEHDLSMILEFGTQTKDYMIRGNPVLHFEPEPGTWDEYPLAAQNADGTITIGEVEHPGVEGYEYFEDTFDRTPSWQEELDDEIERAIEQARAKAGIT